MLREAVGGRLGRELPRDAYAGLPEWSASDCRLEPRCCCRSLSQMVRLALDHGADVNAGTGEALIAAIVGGHEDVVGLLIER